MAHFRAISRPVSGNNPVSGNKLMLSRPILGRVLGGVLGWLCGQWRMRQCTLSALFITSLIAATFINLTGAKADHGPQTWQATEGGVVVVEPTWPGFARPGFGAPPGVAPAGTGIVYPFEGVTGSYIVTAAHVVERASKIEVLDANGARIEARLHALDVARDVAVLHVTPTFTPLRLANAEPPVGTHVCALVNAFGLGITFTCGVVSAVQQKGIGFNDIEDFIQTDAAVNPGASGGALVLADGALIGMVDAIFTKEADIDAGVNFAVSLDMIKQSIEAMRASGTTF